MSNNFTCWFGVVYMDTVYKHHLLLHDTSDLVLTYHAMCALPGGVLYSE